MVDIRCFVIYSIFFVALSTLYSFRMSYYRLNLSPKMNTMLYHWDNFESEIELM